MMHMLYTKRPACKRGGFTLAELLIVILIIAILVAISTAAYLGVFRTSQERLTKGTLNSVAAAVQAYYNEKYEYPEMRFGDNGLPGTPGFSPAPLPNADQSMAALIYQLQYRSSAGDLLSSLPANVLVPLNLTVTDAGQVRLLYTIRDSWGHSIQYLRPRTPAGAPAGYALLPAELNNRVLLVSMGKDGQPGQEGTDTPKWPDGQDYPNPIVLKQGKGDDIVVQVGSAQ